jgi:hypothetical protein
MVAESDFRAIIYGAQSDYVLSSHRAYHFLLQVLGPFVIEFLRLLPPGYQKALSVNTAR